MPATDGDLKRMGRDIASAAALLKDSKDVLIVTHIDADGISAGSIASTTADRLGMERETVFQKKITDETVEMVNSSERDVVWICDLGSAYLSRFTRPSVIITDHHVPDPQWRRKQTTLESFSDIHHINPHCYGMDGSFEACGAGMTYLLSKEVDPTNIDLAWLAVVGAVGDFQDTSESRLVGLNKSIVRDAVGNGDLVVEEDLRLFGRETRPVIQLLQYSSDPQIPGLSDNPGACSDLVDRLDIPIKRDGKLRVWNDLSPDEKESICDAVLSLMPPGDSGKIFGEMYTFPKQPAGTGLRDAKEFATILNSCGRYDDAETGLRICCGDPTALADADRNRAEHRKHISSAMTYIRNNHLIRERRFIQYFEAGTEIRETVVGIVAGMMLNTPECRSDLPIIAFAEADDGIKVSARANRSLVDRGLDLSRVMKTAAELVGGFGGGHSVAAGATIPPGSTERFLDIVEDLVSAQVERSQEAENIPGVGDHRHVRVQLLPVVFPAGARQHPGEHRAGPAGGHPIGLVVPHVEDLRWRDPELPGELHHRNRRRLGVVVFRMVPAHDDVESARQTVDLQGGLGVAPGAARKEADLQPPGLDGGDALLAPGECHGLVDELQLDGCEHIVYLPGYLRELGPSPVGLEPLPDGAPRPLGGVAEIYLLPRDAVGFQHLQVGAVQPRIIDMGLEESPVEVEPHRLYGP